MNNPARLIFLQGPDAPGQTIFGIGESWEEAFVLAAKAHEESAATIKAMKEQVPPRPRKKKNTLH